MRFSSSAFRILIVSVFLPLAVSSQVSAPQSPAQQPPTGAVPAPSPGFSSAGYQLGPGDTVRITVWTGNDYQDQSLTVASDGTLMLPFFVNKLVSVSGLTSLQLRDLVQSEMRKVFLNPVVQVVITGFESKRANLVGEGTMGRFPITDDTPILNFVLQHGGFSARADLTAVQVTRANGERLKVNVYDIVLKGDKSQNIVLHPEDVVFVPPVETTGKKYYMIGEVRSPGLLRSTEDLTLLEAIARAGTLTLTAQGKHVFVIRQHPPGTAKVMDIRFEALYKAGDPRANIRLESEDIVYVPRSRRARMTDAVSAITPMLYFLWPAVTIRDWVSP
jgi:protein involved in polysaccharide export with SLBB domain